jgi:hypothetical protein
MLLLQYGLLCFGLPSYKADLVVRDDVAISVAASHPGDDREMLKKSDVDSLHSHLDKRELQTLLRKLERNKRRDALEGKVNISTSGNSYGMENRAQESNPTCEDNFWYAFKVVKLVFLIITLLIILLLLCFLCCGRVVK